MFSIELSHRFHWIAVPDCSVFMWKWQLALPFNGLFAYMRSIFTRQRAQQPFMNFMLDCSISIFRQRILVHVRIISCMIIIVFWLCTKAHSIHVTCAHWKDWSSCFVEVLLLKHCPPFASRNKLERSEDDRRSKWLIFVLSLSRSRSEIRPDSALTWRGNKCQKEEARFSETRKTEQNSVKSNDNMIPQLPQLMIYMTHVHPILSMDAFGSSFHLLWVLERVAGGWRINKI